MAGHQVDRILCQMRSALFKVVESGQSLLLSAASKKRSERFVLGFAIASYLIHLTLIVMANRGVLLTDSTFLSNPISAIYTPFSFILVYEVYLLLFYLPQSTSFYIGKQYEIITLIVIRRIFKDLGNLEFQSAWFQNENDLQFTFDVLTSLVLFFLIFLFYHKVLRRPTQAGQGLALAETDQSSSRFIFLKKCIALSLVPVLVGLAVYSFTNWMLLLLNDQTSGLTAVSNINNIFFDEFFTILIVVDVLILLASFFYSDLFHTIIRNSGFVLSTILLKLSFSVTGILSNILIVGAVLFGLLVLLIHQQFEQFLHRTSLR